MRARAATLAALGAIGVAVIPAYAATPKPQITDPAGDANGVNDQGFGTDVPPSTATPVGLSAADIRGLTFQTTFRTKIVKRKKVLVPTGSKITLSLSAAPDSNTFYSIDVTSPGCKSVGFIYDSNALPLYQQNRALCADKTPSTTIDGPSAKVSGKSIVWTLPLSTFPVGTKLTGISATTLTGAVPLVVIDQTAASTYAFTVGK
jgi:hypothetical protein